METFYGELEKACCPLSCAELLRCEEVASQVLEPDEVHAHSLLQKSQSNMRLLSKIITVPQDRTFVAFSKNDVLWWMMQIVTRGWGLIGNVRCCLQTRSCSSVDDAHCNIGNEGDVLQDMIQIQIVTRGWGVCSRSLLIANEDDKTRVIPLAGGGGCLLTFFVDCKQR